MVKFNYQPPCPICKNWVRLEGLNINNPNPHAEACPWYGIDIPQPDAYLIFWHIKKLFIQNQIKLGEAASYLGMKPDETLKLFGVKSVVMTSNFIDLQKKIPNLVDTSSIFLEIEEKDQGEGCPYCGGTVYMVKALRPGADPKAADPEDFYYYTECLSCAGTGPWDKTFAGAIAWHKMRPSKKQQK